MAPKYPHSLNRQVQTLHLAYTLIILIVYKEVISADPKYIDIIGVKASI